MTRWTCPACEREFGRAHQSHVCVPAGTVDDCFAGRPGYQREVYEMLVAHLRTLGEVHVDAVRVGVFLKHERKLAEVRPKARGLSLDLVLPRRLDDPRVTRVERLSADRVVNRVRLTCVDDVDDRVRGWLSEAWFAAAAGAG